MRQTSEIPERSDLGSCYFSPGAAQQNKTFALQQKSKELESGSWLNCYLKPGILLYSKLLTSVLIDLIFLFPEGRRRVRWREKKAYSSEVLKVQAYLCYTEISSESEDSYV